MSTPVLPSVSFVKRAVLQSDDKGHVYDVELESGQGQGTKDSVAQLPLYEQLAKNIAERREQKVEGRPEELSIEDQEFVNRVTRQKEAEVLKYEEETQEFKKQRLLKATMAQASSVRAENSALLTDKKEATSIAELPESSTVVFIKKKKKKTVSSSTSNAAQ